MRSVKSPACDYSGLTNEHQHIYELHAVNLLDYESLLKIDLRSKTIIDIKVNKHGGIFWTSHELYAACDVAGLDKSYLHAVVKRVNLSYDVLRHLAPQQCHAEIYPHFDDRDISMRNCINSAKEYIFMTTMIFERDTFGGTVIEALARAAERGVIVRIMVDGGASMTQGWNIQNLRILLRHKNIKIKDIALETLPKSIWKMRRSYVPKSIRRVYDHIHASRKHIDLARNANSVVHSKFMVVDNTRGYLASMNISDDYIDNWDDALFVFDGRDMAHRLTWQFAFHWSLISKWKLALPKLDDDVFEPNVALITNMPCVQNATGSIYEHIIWHATDKVVIKNPYITSHPILDAFVSTPNGEHISIVTSTQHTDDPISKTIIESNAKDIIENGLTMYEPERFGHAKICVTSGSVVYGSYNLNNRSAIRDFETSLICRSANAVESVQDYMRRDIEKSELLKPVEHRTTIRMMKSLAQIIA